MKTCPHCYHKNPDTAYTCASCQSPLDSSTPVAETRVSTAAEIILEPGDVIAAKYKIIRQLGQGGMGSVYLVEEIALEKQYALKLISPFHLDNPEARLRFKQEVSICREMYHPAIVRVFDFGESELQQGQYYFTMEYLQGKTLGELLRSRQGTLPPFTLEEIRLVMTPLLEALAYAHKFTVHRDIKPDNIMVKGEFPEVEIRILDFGIARTMSVSRFTMTSQELGTALYIAPEQMQGAHGVDARTDIYSVSVVLYEMLTNSNSPGLDLPSDLLPPAYAPFDAMVKKGLAKDPARRYPDAPAMLETLQQTLDRCETTLQQEEEAEKRRIAEEQRKKEKEARKKALAEEEKRRKEEEKKQQERERQQKIKKLESSLEESDEPSDSPAPPQDGGGEATTGKWSGIIIAILLLAVLGGGVWYFSTTNSSSGLSPEERELVSLGWQKVAVIPYTATINGAQQNIAGIYLPEMAGKWILFQNFTSWGLWKKTLRGRFKKLTNSHPRGASRVKIAPDGWIFMGTSKPSPNYIWWRPE